MPRTALAELAHIRVSTATAPERPAVDRWVDAVVAEAAAAGEHPRDHLKATTALLIHAKVDALTRMDRVTADRAEAALSAIRRRLRLLLN